MTALIVAAAIAGALYLALIVYLVAGALAEEMEAADDQA